MDDNLLKAGGAIRHHGEIPESNEDMSPSLENFVVSDVAKINSQ